MIECRRAQPTVGNATPKRAGLHKQRKQARNQHSSMVAASGPASRFLLWLHLGWTLRYKLKYPFLAEVL